MSSQTLSPLAATYPSEVKSHDGAPTCNLFVACLPPHFNDQLLRQLFSPYGNIVSAKVMVNLETKMSRQYGFVLFARTSEAEAAVQGLNNKQLLDAPSPLHVTFASHNDSQSGAPCERLYVRNLPHWLTSDALHQAFQQFGTIVEATVLPDPSRPGHNRGVGFVRFSTVEEATNALHRSNHTAPFGEANPILVRFMESESTRAARQRNRALRPAGPSQRTLTSPQDALPQLGSAGNLLIHTNPVSLLPPSPMSSVVYPVFQANPPPFVPFPSTGDLFVNNALPEAILAQLFLPWGKIQLMTPISQSAVALRLADPHTHITVAQQLNGVQVAGQTLSVAVFL